MFIPDFSVPDVKAIPYVSQGYGVPKVEERLHDV